jgi:hypothetical protein
MLDTSGFGGSAVARHVRTIRALFGRQVRTAGHALRLTSNRSGPWRWLIPVGGFGLCAAVLVVAGIMSGVSALEYIPIALFEALVIGGLFIVCLSPVSEPPDSDDGGKGPGDDPTSAPPPFDPTLWVTVLDPDATPDADGAGRERELVGARR